MLTKFFGLFWLFDIFLFLGLGFKSCYGVYSYSLLTFVFWEWLKLDSHTVLSLWWVFQLATQSAQQAATSSEKNRQTCGNRNVHYEQTKIILYRQKYRCMTVFVADSENGVNKLRLSRAKHSQIWVHRRNWILKLFEDDVWSWIKSLNIDFWKWTCWKVAKFEVKGSRRSVIFKKLKLMKFDVKKILKKLKVKEDWGWRSL